MILYSEDWPKYPEAIADYNTTNESFLKLADVLKGMCKKNYNVFLALHNKMLSGVNPFASDITQEQMMMIRAEVIINPWYLFREVMRINALEKGGVMQLLWREFANNS